MLKYITNIYQMSLGVMLITSLLFVTGSLSELRSRDMIISSIESEISKLEKAGLKDKLENLENILNTAKQTKVFGALSGNDSVYSIRKRLALASGGTIEENVNNNFIASLFGYYSYDFLLSLSMMMASYAGASCFCFYKRQRHNVREESLGAAVGLMLYLSLKGGAFVFLVHNSNISNDSNIYTFLLIALIAGLFSEKLLNYLERLVTDAADTKPVPLGNEKVKLGRIDSSTDRNAIPVRQDHDAMGERAAEDRSQIS